MTPATEVVTSVQEAGYAYGNGRLQRARRAGMPPPPTRSDPGPSGRWRSSAPGGRRSGPRAAPARRRRPGGPAIDFPHSFALLAWTTCLEPDARVTIRRVSHMCIQRCPQAPSRAGTLRAGSFHQPASLRCGNASPLDTISSSPPPVHPTGRDPRHPTDSLAPADGASPERAAAHRSWLPERERRDEQRVLHSAQPNSPNPSGTVIR